MRRSSVPEGGIVRPREIRTKREFFELWEAGLLGNKLRTWRDWREAYASGVSPVGFRQIGRAGGGRLDIVGHDQIPGMADTWAKAQLPYMICEAAPDERATIQGEVCRTVGGWAGLLGHVREGRRMRESMAAGDLVPVQGLQVLDLVNRYMDASSRDDLDALLEIYPDASVEFTCYTVKVGFLQRNTIFWEVRNY